MSDRMPLVLLSGMAADDSLFAPQQAAFADLITPRWIAPLPLEPLCDYAARLARTIDPGTPCIVGGVSFGGIVALEMASHLKAKVCVLISSVRSPGEFPWWYRVVRPAAWMNPAGIGIAAGCASKLSAPSLPRQVTRRLGRLARSDAGFLRWATWAALRWQPSARAKRVQVFHIHGSADRTFPIRFTRPDFVVTNGGHLLTLTHPTVVNEQLRRIMTLVRGHE